MASEPTAVPDEQLPVSTDPDASSDAKQPVKRSWRRKYRKMRSKFEETMTLSNTLIKDEYRAMATARRLQEQNDQILDLLLDLNETTRLPPNLRFDLRDSSDIDSPKTLLPPNPDSQTVQRLINDLRKELVDGTISEEDFARQSSVLHSSQAVITNRTLKALETSVPHSTEIPEPAPEGLLLGEQAPGYMSPTHEEEYLLAMDVALAEPSYDPNARDGRPLRVTASRPMPSEKDLTIQNPDSVYNWLRKNQPQVFLQDKDVPHPETLSEKSSAKPEKPSGRGKRPSAGPKADQDMLDDDIGFIPETGTVPTPTATTTKGRRAKQEDDGTYRPKGGSSRGSKRKREEGDTPAKGGRKKNRVSGGAGASS